MHLDIDSTSVWNSIVGTWHHSFMRYSVIWLLMVVENTVSGAAPESTLSVQLGGDMVTETRTPFKPPMLL